MKDLQLLRDIFLHTFQSKMHQGLHNITKSNFIANITHKYLI
jgi:hypothetical protein